MHSSNHILQYILAGIIVILLGGVTGWYVFIHRQIATTEATDAARGFGSTAPSFGSGTGQTGVFGGGAGNSSGFAITGAGATGADEEGSVAPRLWHITPNPVAGIGFRASSTLLYLAERATGNILYADPSLSKVTRMTNTLFPKVYEASFSGDGTAILRFLSDSGAITTFVGRAASSTEDASAPRGLEGVQLAANIPAVALRTNGTQLFWLLPEGQRGVTGIVSDIKGGSQKKIFSSGLTGWRTMWTPDGTLFLLQKPSDDIPGYAFRLTTSGTITSIVGGVPGLTILPRSSSGALLYGSSASGLLSMYVQATSDSTPVRLSIRTVADKCVWAPDSAHIAYCAVPQSLSSGAFLRQWYAGQLHTADAWWKINAAAGTAEILFRPDGNTVLDVENPVIDATGTYIGFMNATDQSPWLLKID
jgi:hypothetical protein